jgi:hypothetical protein
MTNTSSRSNGAGSASDSSVSRKCDRFGIKCAIRNLGVNGQISVAISAAALPNGTPWPSWRPVRSISQTTMRKLIQRILQVVTGGPRLLARAFHLSAGSSGRGQGPRTSH